MKSVQKEIARIISRAAMVPESEIRPESKLGELGVDSLDQVECVIAVEETFQIEMEPERLWQLETVQDMIDAVETAMTARS